jgi:hypothetical protein
MQKALEPYGLAYPTGHCPQVKASGYLLSGGMSWNHGVWGSGVGSVETIEMVTADGHLVRARKVDATFSNRPLAELMSATIDHVLSCPSPKTVYMFAVYTGGETPPTPPDASFSMTGKIYGGPWSMWERPLHF